LKLPKPSAGDQRRVQQGEDRAVVLESLTILRLPDRDQVCSRIEVHSAGGSEAPEHRVTAANAFGEHQERWNFFATHRTCMSQLEGVL
jgi:hypothetical protein